MLLVIAYHYFITKKKREKKRIETKMLKKKFKMIEKVEPRKNEYKKKKTKSKQET